MLNRYSLWKYFLIVGIVLLGFIYSLPNLYQHDFAIQISSMIASEKINASVQEKIKTALTKSNIKFQASDNEKKNFLIRLKQSDQQQLAKLVIKNTLGDGYIVALSLVPKTPDWLVAIGAYPMKLGLDLSGGVHFQLEVDTARAVKNKLVILNTEIRTLLRKEKLRYRTMPEKEEDGCQLAFLDAATRDQAKRKIKQSLPNLLIDTKDQGENFVVSYHFSEQYIRELEDYAIKQNLITVRNRVDELGIAEPLVQRRGHNNIVVELPGVQDAAEAKRILGKTANLEFRLEALSNAAKRSTELFDFPDKKRHRILLEREIIITGDHVSSAKFNFDVDSGQPQVNIKLDNRGSLLMNHATRNNIGRSMAVIFIEQKPIKNTQIKSIHDESVQVKGLEFFEERRIISLATIQSALSKQFRITGLNTGEASELALLLRAGSLAAPMYFIEERIIGPSLGFKNVKMGIDSILMGLSMVVMFMIAVYRMFGLLANIALTINLVLLTGAMSIFHATLTMSGIAGIVLTLGMAVDANILIFSRIREEIKLGRSLQLAIHNGYKRAFISIFDGNITTLLVGLILFFMGSGPITGFAVTLSIGIVTSMFTAIMVTRGLINLVYGGRRNLKKLNI